MEPRNCDCEQCREVDLTVGILTDREWLLTKMFCLDIIRAGVLGPKACEITCNAVGAFAHMPDRASEIRQAADELRNNRGSDLVFGVVLCGLALHAATMLDKNGES
jgi:hypothetical protein